MLFANEFDIPPLVNPLKPHNSFLIRYVEKSQVVGGGTNRTCTNLRMFWQTKSWIEFVKACQYVKLIIYIDFLHSDLKLFTSKNTLKCFYEVIRLFGVGNLRASIRGQVRVWSTQLFRASYSHLFP